MSELTDYIDAQIAKGLVERGVPWQVVHCGLCGHPLPKADHECPPQPMPDLKGILS